MFIVHVPVFLKNGRVHVIGYGHEWLFQIRLNRLQHQFQRFRISGHDVS